MNSLAPAIPISFYESYSDSLEDTKMWFDLEGSDFRSFEKNIIPNTLGMYNSIAKPISKRKHKNFLNRPIFALVKDSYEIAGRTVLSEYYHLAKLNPEWAQDTQVEISQAYERVYKRSFR